MDNSEPQSETGKQEIIYPRLLDPKCPHDWQDGGIDRAICPLCGKVERVGDTVIKTVSIAAHDDDNEDTESE